MKRREFIALASSAALAPPVVARAQEPGRTYRIGGLFPFPRDAPQNAGLAEALRQAGFIEGQNLEWRRFALRTEQLSDSAAELVKAHVDVIMAGGDAAIRAAQQATATIPILGFTDDMVGSGLVTSMARPSGNTTGISLLAAELDGKRQELLTEMVPSARRIAALVDTGTTPAQRLETLEAAARARNVELSLHRIAKPEEIAAAMEAAKQAGALGVNVLASPILFGARQQIIERAAALGLPAIYQWPETAEEGGLAGYGPRIVELFQDLLAKQLVRLLRGAKPADLPVQQPTKFELVINLKTAKALGLGVPQPILARADEVIE